MTTVFLKLHPSGRFDSPQDRSFPSFSALKMASSSQNQATAESTALTARERFPFSLPSFATLLGTEDWLNLCSSQRSKMATEPTLSLEISLCLLPLPPRREKCSHLQRACHSSCYSAPTAVKEKSRLAKCRGIRGCSLHRGAESRRNLRRSGPRSRVVRRTGQ